jgi:hypothetical protein
MISAVDWRNDGLCSICLPARIAPSVVLALFGAGVIRNNTRALGLEKQGVWICLASGRVRILDAGEVVNGGSGHTRSPGLGCLRTAC